MKRFNFWQTWLTWANVMTAMVGLLAAFAGNSILFEIHNSYSRDVFFDGSPLSENVLQLKNWLFGIIGGVTVGFHVLMIFISVNAFRNKEKWAYYAIWSGLLSWFVIDSFISYYTGAIHNILLINVFALVLIGLPLVMTRTYFK